MAEVHVNIVSAPHIVGKVHNPDGQGGSNAKTEGTTLDAQAKIIAAGTVPGLAWKNPA